MLAWVATKGSATDGPKTCSSACMIHDGIGGCFQYPFSNEKAQTNCSAESISGAL